MKNWTWVVGVLVMGCGASAAYNRLPAYQKAAFERCSHHVTPSVCPGAPADDTWVQMSCVQEAADRYANASPRDHWLTGHGCPAPVVYYQAAGTAD